MKQTGIQLGNTAVVYGKTTVEEILNAGYTISEFTQILEEPVIATCNLNENNKKIGLLSFFQINEKMTIDDLAHIPIDLILLDKKAKTKKTLPKQKAAFRIFWTIFVHLTAAAVFCCIYANPALYIKISNSTVSRSTPLGMVLIVLPAIVNTFIWDGSEVKHKPILHKIGLSLWLILNVIITLAYLIAIHIAFLY